MTWLRLDDTMPEHPKVVGLPVEAKWLHIEGLAYCNRSLTDGEVPAPIARRYGSQRSIDALVAAGLWKIEGGSYWIHDYLEYNPSRAVVESKKASKRLAGARGGARKAANQRASTVVDQNPTHITSPTHHITSHPEGVEEHHGFDLSHPSLDGFVITPDQTHLLASMPQETAQALIPVMQDARKFGVAASTEALRRIRAALDSGTPITNLGGFFWHHAESAYREAMEAAQ